MNTFAIGLWGCFFGMVTAMLLGSVLAYAKALPRIALNTAITAISAAFFILAFLDALPIQDMAYLARLLAVTTALIAPLLGYLLLLLLNQLKTPLQRRLTRFGLGFLALLSIALGWFLTPRLALILSGSMACCLVLGGLLLVLAKARRSDLLRETLTAGLFLLLLTLLGMGWIALDRQNVPELVQVLSALAATLFLVCFAGATWRRYFYLIELQQIMNYGHYDLVTRMRSHRETSEFVEEIFHKFRRNPAPMGIAVLSIGNFSSLEKLHGQAAVNQALFVSASRLRRYAPSALQMGRLSVDGFVLIMPNCLDSAQLIKPAQLLLQQLRRPIKLRTEPLATQLESAGRLWVADVGMGLLMISNPDVPGASAIAMARGMSHTAASYSSRTAWFDHTTAQIVELPNQPVSKSN